MMRTDRHIQVHMPKTAGTWARSVLVIEAGGKDIGGGHDPYSMIPPHERGERVVIGTSRNPWAWYTSLYAHARRNGAGQTSQLAQWGNGSSEFKDVLYGWTHPDRVRDIPLSIGVIFAAKGHLPAHVKQAGVGLCTWAHRYMYGVPGAGKLPCKPSHTTQWGVDLLLATDRLYEGLTTLLGTPVTEEGHPPINTRKQHGAACWVGPGFALDSWYTDENMIDWVAQADREILDLFGWRYGTGAESHTVKVRGD